MNNPASTWRGDLRIASFVLGTTLAVGAPALAFAAPAGAPEVYTVRLSVGASGFEPKKVSAPIGTVHFVVTAREGDHCFAIPSLDVEKRVRSSRPLEVDVAFEKVGEFPFHCCVEGSGASEAGVIVVAPAK